MDSVSDTEGTSPCTERLTREVNYHGYPTYRDSYTAQTINLAPPFLNLAPQVINYSLRT